MAKEFSNTPQPADRDMSLSYDEVLEPGRVIFEAKDRAYDLVGTEEVWGGREIDN